MRDQCLLRAALVGLCWAAMTSAQIRDSSMERRAPQMGFMGMRGKKEEVYTGEEKRAPQMGFMGMRGKKDPDMDYDVEAYKRAPMMGFQGVRGKKDEYYKRAPQMGFMGMRGKKDEDSFPEPDSMGPGLDEPTLQELEKRAPMLRFFGLRGKKGPLSSSFFGVRGKKGPSGFFGMRGKKGPMAGFMGVRGKKDERSEDIEGLLSMLGEEQALDRVKRDARVADASKSAVHGGNSLTNQ